MSTDDKYAAAKQAALGYFEAAGYTVADGKITAAPAGGRMDAEVMVGGSGKGDHPSFMALTLASDALKEIGFNLIVSDMSNFAEMTNAINAGTADMFAMAWQATPDRICSRSITARAAPTRSPTGSRMPTSTSSS